MERQEIIENNGRVKERLDRAESLLEERLITLIKEQHKRFPRFEYGQGEEKREYASKLVSREEIVAAGNRSLGALYIECLQLHHSLEYMKKLEAELCVDELVAIGSGNYR